MKNWIILCLLVFMMSSCIISLHPLYDSQTMVKELKLSGKWLDNDGGFISEWFFQPKMLDNGQFSGKYQLDHTSDGYTYEYEAVLLKLGGIYYLDVLLEGKPEDDTPDDGPILALSVPSHNFYKIEFNQANQVHIQAFDGDRLEKLVAQRKIRIKHEMVDGTMIITASTEDLQKFLLKYAQDKQAFDEPLLLEKTQ